MKKSTIIRTIMIAIVIINLILKATGKNIINIDEGSVAYFVETLIEIAVIAVNFWYNNSFSKNAKKADEFLKQLNESEE